MMLINTGVVILVSVGIFFLFVGGVGALRLPDFFTRSHAIGVIDTLGSLLILGGLILHYGPSIAAAKLFFLLLFIFIANPTITHIFTRAALRAGLKPWTHI